MVEHVQKAAVSFSPSSSRIEYQPALRQQSTDHLSDPGAEAFSTAHQARCPNSGLAGRGSTELASERVEESRRNGSDINCRISLVSFVRPDVYGALRLLKFRGTAGQTLLVVFDRDDFDLVRFDQVDEPEGPF